VIVHVCLLNLAFGYQNRINIVVKTSSAYDTQWRKSRGGRGGHVPLENWTAGTVMHYVPPNLASNLVLYKACLV